MSLENNKQKGISELQQNNMKQQTDLTEKKNLLTMFTGGQKIEEWPVLADANVAQSDVKLSQNCP